MYRPVYLRAPYWQLDDLGGRGVQASSFTTYGPLLTAASVPTSGRVSVGASGWLASADEFTPGDLEGHATQGMNGARRQ
ncbi:hypothetical protein [Streptomyces sp. NPDC002338]